MSNIVGIGACVMDTLVSVPEYPKEDTKLQALSTKVAGGGPVATGLVTAAVLGVSAGYIGQLAEDNGGKFLLQDFEKYGVETCYITKKPGHRSFTSTIWLSQKSYSRTCVFDRGDLPVWNLNHGQKTAIEEAELLMVDGNELHSAVEGARLAKNAGIKVLYDAGGLYSGVEELLCLTDYLIPSEEFATKHTGCASADDAAKTLFYRYHPRFVVVTQGKLGGVLYDGKELSHYPAFSVEAVDTNGAGDVFHGAFAAALIKGFAPYQCCCFASAVSALKCTGVGARESVPGMETVKHFLEEKGYEL